MSAFDYDIGIIGGGAAGLTVAAGSAQLGAKTLLIEKEEALGGDCLHFGCVPSKTLIRTARVFHMMKHAGRYGLPEVEAGPVDFGKVAARIRSVISTIQAHDSEERFCQLGARVEFGRPEFADEHSVRMNGKTYSAKNWVISTGSGPSVPTIEGLSDTPFVTNKEIFSLERLPSSMIVLGAGPLGIEMAQAFCRLGTKVAVVQRGSQILSREDPDMANMVMEVMRSEGVLFYLNATLLRTKDAGQQREVVVRIGEKEEALRAETVLVSLGRAVNTGGLGLEKIGLDFGAKGIRVDNRMRTSHKHIYAAGDVTGAWQFTHAAGYEGGIIVSNAVFHLPRRANYTWMPWCTYTDPELASIGMNEKRASAAGINYTAWVEHFEDNDRSLAEGERVGKLKMLLDEDERPIGVQILGPHAGELLGEWAAVMNAKVKLTTLASAVHPYPTLGEINKRIAGDFLSGKIFSERVRRGLRFFFNLKGRACIEAR